MFSTNLEHSSALATAPSRSAAEFSSVATTAPRCVIVARHEERREQLAEAAVRSGWAVVDLDNVEQALETIDRYLFELAVIDGAAEDEFGVPASLRDAESPRAAFADDDPELAELKRLVETVAAERGALLAVCGEEGNAMQEIWARGLGAWLYLTGELDPESLPFMYDAAREATDQVARAREAKQGWRYAASAA